MKGKAVLSVLLMLVTAVFMLGCGGGGGGSNPAASDSVGNATVTGIVKDLSDKPVNGASVRMVLTSKAILDAVTKSNGLASARFAVASRMSAAVPTEFNTKTDASGKYTFTGVPEGDYTLSAVTPDGAQIVTSLSVRASDVPVPDMQLKPLGTITGQVTLSGSGVMGAIVYAKGTSYAAITDASGNYSISDVPVSTELTLCVQSSEGTASEQKVTITDLKTRTFTAKAFALTAVTTSTCKLDVTLSAANNDINLNKCVVFAVCTDGTTYLATCKADSTGKTAIGSFKISHAGSYNIFPAYYDSDIIALTSTPATDNADITDSNIKGAATVTKAFKLSSTTSAFASIEAKISSSASGDYKAVLIDHNGNENKKSVSAGGSVVFNNLAANNYVLVVYNDTNLFVRKNITVTDGEKANLNEITPVTVTPTITAGNGSVSFTPGSLKTAVDTTSDTGNVAVLYYPLAHNKDNDTYANLYKYDDKGSMITSFAASEAQTETLYTDVCSTGSNVPSLKVLISVSGVSKPLFGATFENASADLGSKLWKTVALEGISQSSDIVYFKTINYDGTINYLVVTLDTAYLFDAAGKLKSSMALPERLTSNGNVCFVESDGTNPNLLVALYHVPSPDANTPASIKITGSEISLGTIKGFDKSYLGRGDFPANGEFTVYSPNKIHAIYELDSSGTSSQKVLNVFCACDRCYANAKLNPSDFAEISFSKEALNTYVGGSYLNVVASCTSFAYVESGEKKYCDFYFLGCDETANTIVFGKKAIGNNAPFYNTVARNIRDMSAITTTLENLPICGDYKLYALKNRSDFPFFLTASFNGNRNQALINDSQSNNTFCLFDDYNYLHGDSKITTSGVNSGYERYCIERSSNGQFLTGFAYSNEVIQRIRINQIMNSNGYLEDSLGFVTVSGTPQYHLICADNSGNPQIMIINR